jgi:hypothetical protein
MIQPCSIDADREPAGMSRTKGANMTKGLAAVAIVTLAASASLAQTPQPYAGLQQRSIKALSDQQIADLRAGRGMGLALAAELNGYPGPLHVLELADDLVLSSEQRLRVQQLCNEMKAETIPLGEALISLEANLDRQFADRVVTPASLADATAAIGPTQGAVRFAHLKYHLATIGLLTDDQVRRYAKLRGYANGADGQEHHQGSQSRDGNSSTTRSHP